MTKRELLAAVLVVLVFAIQGIAWGGSESVPAQGARLAAADRTGQELLLFFEEQDLVTATRRATSLRKAPAIATIITADEIRNMGARNLLDVLKTVPGLGISVTEFGANMIEVRGIRTGINEKILFMIDGHSLNKNINGSALYNVTDMLPMENIRQVEVVRGPGSALYGNSAFVATINVITRDAEEIDGLEARVGGGSFDTFKGNLVGGKAIGEKLTLSGSIDHYRTRGPELTVEADALTGTPFSLAPGTPNLDFRQTAAFLKAGYGDLSFRGHFLTRRKEPFIGLGSALTDDSSKDRVDNYWAELAYAFPLAEGLSASLKLYNDFYEQTPNVKIYPNGFAGAFPDGVIGRPLVKDRTLGGELQVDWDAFEGNHLIAGVAYEALRQYDVRQEANFDPAPFADIGPVQPVANWNRDVTRRIFAAYLQDEWELPARVNLTAGVRYDRYSDFGDTVNPRAALVWSFLENADLKLLYGQAFRAPNFQELYDINNPIVVGNPDLKPERIKSYEAGLAWRLNRYFAANLNYFFSAIDDQIGWDTATTPAVNANIGNSKTQGVEMGINGDYGAGIRWRAAYAWQDPRDANTDRRLPYVPSHRASGTVDFDVTNYLSLHGDLLWTGTRGRGPGDDRPRMPAYATVDLAATLKNVFETLEIQAAVRNLFDRRYKDPDTSGGNVNLAGTGPKVPGDFPREGISFFMTASYGI
jgi:iron complex outermembrane receptor protein